MTPLIFLIPILMLMSLTPWQLFQQMCPLVSPNSPQCLRQQPFQQQIPQQQQSQQFNNFTFPQQQPLP